MKIKAWYITVIIFFSTYGMNAQDRDTIQQNQKSNKNAMYIELLGAGILHSLNYERLIVKTKRVDLWARIGVAPIYLEIENIYHFVEEYNNPYAIIRAKFIFPIGLTMVYKRKHQKQKLFFEQSIYFSWVLRKIINYQGTTFFNSAMYWSIYPAGLRFRPNTHGFYYRTALGVMGNLFEVYYNDFITPVRYEKFFPWLSFSVGYSFPIKKNKKHEK